MNKLNKYFTQIDFTLIKRNIISIFFLCVYFVLVSFQTDDTTHVHKTPPPFNQKICLVTVDTALTKNVIVWEKTAGKNIAYFKIYKENIVTHVFDSIGYNPFDSLSYFIDTQSYPKIRSAKYRISTVDSNGVESSLSPFHQTIQLNISKGTGWNFDLTWTPYIGFPVYHYRIWRWSLSNGWVKIDSVQGGTFTYNDSPPLGLVYYFVETVSPHPCNVTKAQTNYNTSRSNRTNTSIFTDVEHINNDMKLSVYPNPFFGETNIEYTLNNQAFVSVEIYSILGNKMNTIFSGTQMPGKYNYSYNKIDFHYKTGVYFLQIKINNRIVSIRKLICTK